MIVMKTHAKDPATEDPPSEAFDLGNNCFHARLKPFDVNQLPTRPAAGSDMDNTNTAIRATVAGKRRVHREHPKRK